MNVRLLISVAAVALGAGCGVEDAPLLLGNFRPFDGTTCNLTTDTNIVSGAGSLDVAVTSRYITPVMVISQTHGVLRPCGQEPGTECVDPEPNTIVIERIFLEYRSEPEIGLADADYPIHFAVSPGSTESWMGVDMFPAAAGDTLLGEVVPGLEVGVIVSVSAAGQTRAGTAVRSPPADFPITVFNSGFPGCGGGFLAPTGPCGNTGQDGSLLACCPDPNVPECPTTP
jgi:hypothetical protein